MSCTPDNLPRTCTTARPQLAKADTAFQGASVGQPTEPCLGPAALSGALLIVVAQHLAKMNNHDFRAPIFGVGREVAINRGIPILVITTTNPSRPSADGSAGSASRFA